MNDDSILGATLGQLGQTAKKVGQQIVKLPEEMAADVGGQIGGVKKPEENKDQQSKPQKQWQSDEERVKFLKDLYGPSKQNPWDKPTNQQSASEKKPTEFQEQIADKTPEEQKELTQLRQQLHKQVYYDPTFNPQKKQEERPAEKVEKEKKMEALELEEKNKKKPPPLAVVREQNKAEQFRGASG